MTSRNIVLVAYVAFDLLFAAWCASRVAIHWRQPGTYSLVVVITNLLAIGVTGWALHWALVDGYKDTKR